MFVFPNFLGDGIVKKPNNIESVFASPIHLSKPGSSQFIWQPKMPAALTEYIY